MKWSGQRQQCTLVQPAASVLRVTAVVIAKCLNKHHSMPSLCLTY